MKYLLLAMMGIFAFGCGDMWNEKRYDEGEFTQQREQIEDDNDIIQVLPEEKEESD
tara:strand:+ start:226465 stop:226632 length:168 start_codon:yes stop_codon:yes gene_type:complete